MPNYNKVLLMGHLTRDVECRYTPKGSAVAQIGLAVSRKWKDDAYNQKEETVFVDCEAWGRTAETMAQYLGKGKPVFIEGRLKLDQWEDKETGQKRSKIKVVVESFQFVAGKTDDTPNQPAQQPRTTSAPAPSVEPDATSDESDSIPF
jgi:single-strand DNA-binding protein